MKNERNNYGIRNPDGMIRERYGETKSSFANDARRFVRETPLDKQREIARQAEDFDLEKTRIARPSSAGQPTAGSVSDLQSVADQSFAASSTASSAASAASTATTATAAATGTASGAAAAGAATVAATATTGAVAVAGTVAATVATAVMVVAVFVSTLAINLSLLLAGMTSLIFRVEMTGVQDEDFETPIYASITDGEEFYEEQQIFRDTLVLSFLDLAPGTEYTVTVKNEEKVFFEKTYVTATEEVERGFLSAWNEKNEIFISVEGVILSDLERFTVTAKDERGNVIFARDGVEESAEFSFTLDKPRNLFFTLVVGGKTAAATEIRMLNDLTAQYDFDNPTWTWSDDRLTAEVSFESFFGGDPLILTAEVTETVDAEPDCENDGRATCSAVAYYGDREFFDEQTAILPAYGHGYTAAFDWIEGGDDTYVGARVTLTCSHDPDHTVESEATLTREDYDATCTGDAYTVYIATVERDGETFRDSRTVVREGTAQGHVYPNLNVQEPDESAFDLTRNENGEVTAATLTLTCMRCQEAQTIPANEVERMTWNRNLCEDTEAEYYLFWNGDGIMEYAKYVTVDVIPQEHDYQPVWEWEKNVDGWYSEDGATLCFVCSHDESHRIEAGTATVAEDRDRYVEATCDTPAESIYVATVEYEGETYTDERPVVWEYSALGHDFAEDPNSFTEEELAQHVTLTQNDNGEIVAATLTLHCARCDRDVTMDATEIEVMPSEQENLCENGGTAEYYVFWNGNGLEYAMYPYPTVEVGPIGHDYYEEPYYEWDEEEYTSATAFFTCRHGDHPLEVPTDLTHEYIQPTCNEGAYTLYTASLIFGGVPFSDTRRVDDPENPALGHDFPDPHEDDENDDSDGVVIEYRHDETGAIVGATMYLTCARCGGTFAYEADEIELTSPEPDLCNGETVEYYVFWGSDGMEVDKYPTATLAGQGHDYPDPEDVDGDNFEWLEDGEGGYTANLLLTCSRNPDHVETVPATVTRTTDATGVTFHAEATYDGKTYEGDYVPPTTGNG